LDITLGSVYKLSDKINLLFDVSYQFASEFDLYQTQQISANENRVETVGTFRVNTGLEYIPKAKRRWYAGAFWNPTAKPDIENQISGTQESYYGVTGGVHRIMGNVRAGLGAYYIWGIGKGVLFGDNNVRLNQIASTRYELFGIILTSGYNFD
jgi:hypothetical protein